jgi:hypothetical protein
MAHTTPPGKAAEQIVLSACPINGLKIYSTPIFRALDPQQSQIFRRWSSDPGCATGCFMHVAAWLNALCSRHADQRYAGWLLLASGYALLGFIMRDKSRRSAFQAWSITIS